MGEGGRRPVRTISLFSGAGGLDIGFDQAGYDLVACVEIDGNYCKTLEANRGEGKTFGTGAQIICEDVRQFRPEQFSRHGIECIIGGPPCQTFSAAGRRSGGVLGTEDARGRLFTVYCRILKVLRPKVFVFENVYGLPGANNGGPWRQIKDAFSALGYRLKADVLDAADYGVPQHRERLIMVGHREGGFEFPAPTHGPDSSTGRPLVSVREAIADLQKAGEQERDDLGGLYGHLLPLVPPGLNYAFFTREMGHPEPIFAWRSKFHDFLYKVDPDSPCRTIKARPGKFTGPFHWKNRHFSIEELKRLQSFPDSYQIVGNYGAVVEQIGNSVPPHLALVIATSVREQLLDGTRRLTYPSRSFGYTATFRRRQRDRTNHFKAVAKTAIAERFGGRKHPAQRDRKKRETYYVTHDGFFAKSVVRRKPKVVAHSKTFRVSTDLNGDEMQLTFAPLGKHRSRRIKIEIGGLHEGLTILRRVNADATVRELGDIFFVWVAIEHALIRCSKFLTLIDIYGHYANRGDTVTVDTDIIGGSSDSLQRAMRLFCNAANCGVPMPRATLKSELSVSEQELDAIILEMRAMRFDVRTRATHPTMPPQKVLCTYPFPLLSQKAHVERRLKGESSDDDKDHIAQGLLFR